MEITWEKAKERAGAILKGKAGKPQSALQEGKCEENDNHAEPNKKLNVKGNETKKPEPHCPLHRCEPAKCADRHKLDGPED